MIIVFMSSFLILTSVRRFSHSSRQTTFLFEASPLPIAQARNFLDRFVLRFCLQQIAHKGLEEPVGVWRSQSGIRGKISTATGIFQTLESTALVVDQSAPSYKLRARHLANICLDLTSETSRDRSFNARLQDGGQALQISSDMRQAAKF